MQDKQNLIRRYFENRYSAKDYRKLKEKFEEKPSSAMFVNEMQNHWTEFSGQESQELDVERLLEKVHHKIVMDENRQTKITHRLMILQRIAAILFIPLLLASLAFFFFGNNTKKQQAAWAEIQCPNGVRTHFELPDGSTGYLNSGSKLSYQIPFSNDRQVKLSGEAYFDVTHDKNLPFHVITNNLDIKVLGTRFNVLAFDDLNFEEVTLEKGKIEVYNNNHKLISSLEPNQQLNYNIQTKVFTQKSVMASQYVSWIEGKLIFRDEKFDQVAKRLGRWYNAEIVTTDARLNDYVFHATFVNEQLEEALKLIELTTPITYQLQKREKMNDGSFANKRVILNFSEEKLKEFK